MHIAYVGGCKTMKLEPGSDDGQQMEDMGGARAKVMGFGLGWILVWRSRTRSPRDSCFSQPAPVEARESCRYHFSRYRYIQGIYICMYIMDVTVCRWRSTARQGYEGRAVESVSQCQKREVSLLPLPVPSTKYYELPGMLMRRNPVDIKFRYRYRLHNSLHCSYRYIRSPCR